MVGLVGDPAPAAGVIVSVSPEGGCEWQQSEKKGQAPSVNVQQPILVAVFHIYPAQVLPNDGAVEHERDDTCPTEGCKLKVL